MHLAPTVHRLFLLVLLGAAPALAQAPRLALPDPSPHASVSQRVGLTDIAIDYHRPAVGKRKIWGALVPYDEPWRAGANENTTITFSSPVTVGGKQLAAGTYGLHTIPTAKTWTVALSTVSTAWGSFTYDPKEDAVRFTVTPTPAEHEESLEYRFENPTETSTTVVLHWEKLQIAFPITVDTKAVTLASVKGQLRGLQKFFWQPWNNAATWCIRSTAGRTRRSPGRTKSIKVQPSFANLTEGQADREEGPGGASKLRADAMKMAGEADVNVLAYQLLADKKNTEALDLFRKNVKDHPDSWNAHDSLGEALATTGDKKGAVASYERALALTQDPAQKKRINTVLAGLR
jgi:hypothetical protein